MASYASAAESQANSQHDLRAWLTDLDAQCRQKTAEIWAEIETGYERFSSGFFSTCLEPRVDSDEDEEEERTCREVAALIGPDCIIAAHEALSCELERQLAETPSDAFLVESYQHWIRGVYLITMVQETAREQKCGEDGVVAVNLTRVCKPVDEGSVKRAVASVTAKYRGAGRVRITHFVGGPCETDDIMCCIVPGGGGREWTILKGLSEAVELAYRLEGETGRVFVFWGHAWWSRAQLLEEIAQGNWGLCKANIGDLTAAPSERRANLGTRLAFAPTTDMTKSYIMSGMNA